MSVRQEGEHLTITHSWRSPQRIRLVALMFVGLMGTALVITVFLTHAGWIPARTAGIADLVVLDALVVFAFLLLTSNTVVHVTPQAIRVRHRRYLLPRSHHLPAGRLEQVFCVRVHGTGGTWGAFRFHVAALDGRGRRVILVPNLARRGEARYLEGVIERHLGITDRPVRGEIGREAPTLARRTGHVPSWRWGMRIKRFVSRAGFPFYRVKLFRDGEPLWVTMGRQKRIFTRKPRAAGESDGARRK